MKLTVSNEAHGSIISIDVSDTMSLEDFKAYLEAESDIPPQDQIIILHSKSLHGDKQTLGELGVKDDDLMVLSQRQTNSGSDGTSTNSGNSADAAAAVGSDFDGQIEMMRRQFLDNPQLRNQFVSNNPQMENVLNDPEQFKSVMREQLSRLQGSNGNGMSQAHQQELRQLEQDPDNPENQARILEIIRQEQIDKNLELAYDITPESFTSVSMLYIKIEVNGCPVQAFVDSGAQQTIISPRLAERVGIDRLIDKRYVGEARGVGSTQILGKIHSVPIRIGDSSIDIPCSFTIIDTSVDLLFGLDMLKRHKCVIDLARNRLVVGSNIETPFIPDNEIENNDLLGSALGSKGNSLGFGGNIFSDGAAAPADVSNSLSIKKKPASNAAEAAAKRQNVGSSSGASATGSSGSTTSTATTHKKEHIQQLVDFGFSKDQAIKALDSCQGNVEMAASLLFQ